MGTQVKVNFNGFPGYYGYMSNYNGTIRGGGFDWEDMYYFTKLGIDTIYPNEHTGYNNDLHGSGEGFAAVENEFPYYGFGAFYSPTKETFTLKSGDFASAWDIEQTVKFTTYRGSQQVAFVYVTVSHEGQKINFGSYGRDFKNITKVCINTNYHYAVNQQGAYGQGWQVVVDNLKAVWNGAIPDAHGMRHRAHVDHDVLGAMRNHAFGLSSDGSHSVAPVGAHNGFHSVVTSLDTALGHHGNGGLTAEFTLPAPEHFGT